MKLYQIRPDLWVNLDAICLIIDRGYIGTKRRIRLHTFDGEHNYDLSTEEWTKFSQKMEDMLKCGM